MFSVAQIKHYTRTNRGATIISLIQCYTRYKLNNTISRQSPEGPLTLQRRNATAG